VFNYSGGKTGIVERMYEGMPSEVVEEVNEEEDEDEIEVSTK
jgi:hypothetical protein